MSGLDDQEIERRLRDIPLAAAPRDLRARVLGAAHRHKASRSWTSPGQRRWLAALAVVLLLVFVADGALSRAQRTQLAALSGSTRTIPLEVDQQDPILAEIIADSSVPRLEAGAGAGGTQTQRRTLGPPRLSDPDIELLKEEFHDAPKSLH